MNRTKTLGWLVGAAALLFAGCSSEDGVMEEQTTQTAAQTATKIHVTVGAGISDGDAATRATVEQTGTTRKLKFSAGDKLWVYRQKAQVGNIYVFAGTLAIGTIGTDGTTAQFSGDLSVLKFNSSAPDPDLSSLEGFTAVLIPAGSTSIKTEINQDGLEMLTYEEKGVATGALNDLMAKNTYVRGGFADASNVTLNASTAFFNCTVTGLEASTAYDVRAGNTGEPVSINSDGEGNLHFLAWYHLENEDEDGRAFEYNSDLRFVIGTNKCARLSGKSLYAKVYNMTRAAEPYTKFTITDNTTGDTVEPQNGNYNFNDDADITVSGENEGEYILLWGGNDRVVLSGVTAKSDQPFINEQNGALNVVLSGANSITSTNPIHGDRAISSIGTLYLSGNGTLTVTAYNNSLYGIGCSNYNSSNNSDPSALAATGYIVSRSDTKDNGDGTYTWTYTVGRIIDLSSVTTTDDNGKLYVTARNGDVLTGYFQNEGYVTIADGATVTLSDVNIGAPFEGDHAAIHCLGSANIIVSGSDYNDVNAGYNSDYPAVYVPSGKTLTISGSGRLRAYSNNAGCAACIGGGFRIDCGNIVIAGGTIYATSPGDGAAGIGSGQWGSCGTITITGGTVYATGGQSAAGIGCGNSGSCGDITIGSGITRVEVTKGNYSDYIIGGYNHGTVKIDGKEMSSDQLQYGVNSNPSEVEHIFPNLSSYCEGPTWTLYKE